MSTLTTNYGLVKMELTDKARIDGNNGNWDVVDSKMYELNRGIIYEATATHSGTVWAVTTATTPIGDGAYSIRFTAPVAFTSGDKLTINGKQDYVFKLPNGKSLGNNAWIANAVIVLQIDPSSKVAFFNAGGADTSFVTATEDTILEGYKGANIEGEPIDGTFTLEEQLNAQESKIADIKSLLDSKALPSLDFITAGAAQIVEGYIGSTTTGKPTVGTHTCFNSFESGVVSLGSVSANGSTTSNVTLASGKRPKVVLAVAATSSSTFSVDESAMTINNQSSNHAAIAIVCDGVATFDGTMNSGNQKCKVSINDTGFKLQVVNDRTTAMNGHCDWIAFY